MLAVAAAIEPLRIANQLTKKQLYTWHTITEDGQPVTCSNGLRITPDEALAPLPTDAMGFVCAGVEPEKSHSPAVLAWLRREYRFGRALGGICTGAFALAHAGLLSGRKFTLHWENQPGFAEAFPLLIPTPNIFEADGRITTCGGGNAAIDMMLALIEQRHGPELAIMVADMCIHMRSGARAPQRSAQSVAIGSRNPALPQGNGAYGGRARRATGKSGNSVIDWGFPGDSWSACSSAIWASDRWPIIWICASRAPLPI